jgi:hypothetical protein
LHRIHQTRGASAKNNCVIACDAAHARDGIMLNSGISSGRGAQNVVGRWLESQISIISKFYD